MPDTLKLQLLRLRMKQWAVKLTRGPESLRLNPESTHVASLRFINYCYISSFFSAAFHPSAPSPLHLPSWWYSPVLVSMAGEQTSRDSMTLNSISFWQIFSGPTIMLFFEHRTTHWAEKHRAGQTDIHCVHRGPGLRMRWCLYYCGDAICSLWCRVWEQEVARECCSYV